MIELIKISEEYVEQIFEYRKEFIEAGSSMDGTGSLYKMENPTEYLLYCKQHENKETISEERVPATQFLLVRKSDNKLVGMLQVRHYFNEYLEKFAGHIGYSVRPSERRKGYATKMLQMALPYCKEIGIDKVLISCIDGNIGSETVIRRNAGVYESTVHEPERDVNLKRFWIQL